MNGCKICESELRPLLTGLYCPNDCERTVRVEGSGPDARVSGRVSGVVYMEDGDLFFRGHDGEIIRLTHSAPYVLMDGSNAIPYVVPSSSSS